MYKPGLIALTVKRSRAHASTGRHSYYYICILTPAIMNFCKVVYNLVKPNRNKIRKLHFHYTFNPFEAQTQCSTYYGTFAKRSIAYPCFSKIIYKTLCDLESSTIFCDILAH